MTTISDFSEIKKEVEDKILAMRESLVCPPSKYERVEQDGEEYLISSEGIMAQVENIKYIEDIKKRG